MDMSWALIKDDVAFIVAWQQSALYCTTRASGSMQFVDTDDEDTKSDPSCADPRIVSAGLEIANLHRYPHSAHSEAVALRPWPRVPASHSSAPPRSARFCPSRLCLIPIQVSSPAPPS